MWSQHILYQVGTSCPRHVSRQLVASRPGVEHHSELWRRIVPEIAPICRLAVFGRRRDYLGWVRKTEGFSELHARVHDLSTLLMTVLSHGTVLVKGVTQVFCPLNPWQRSPAEQ